MRLPSRHPLLVACLASLAVAACQRSAEPASTASNAAAPVATKSYAQQHAGDYAVVPLKADLSAFDDNGKHMIALLVQASEVMNDLYWQQSWPDKAALLANAPDEATRALIDLNFGPWDRLVEDTPLLPGIGPRPPGGVFYPQDMSKQEFEQASPQGQDVGVHAAAPRHRQAGHGPVPRRLQGRPRTRRRPAARCGESQRRQVVRQLPDDARRCVAVGRFPAQ